MTKDFRGLQGLYGSIVRPFREFEIRAQGV